MKVWNNWEMWIGTMVFYLDGGFEEVIELIILYHKTQAKTTKFDVFTI